jgi:hypothetical protein
MKKVVLVTGMLFAFVFGAQAQKNTLLVYGNLDVLSDKEGSVKNSTFSISPGIGYQFTDNWTAGLNLAAGNTKYGVAGVKTSSFGVGPFIRYAYPLSDIFAVYGQFNANVLSGKTAGLKSNGFQGTLFPAIGVNLKNGFALNFNFGSLGFGSNKVKGMEKTTNFGLSFGSGAGFGISKNFGLK